MRQLMIEQSHNPNAMKAMLEYKAKPKAIEGVKYEPVKSEVSAAGSGYGNSKAAQRMAARRKAAPINTQVRSEEIASNLFILLSICC